MYTRAPRLSTPPLQPVRAKPNLNSYPHLRREDDIASHLPFIYFSDDNMRLALGKLAVLPILAVVLVPEVGGQVTATGAPITVEPISSFQPITGSGSVTSLPIPTLRSLTSVAGSSTGIPTGILPSGVSSSGASSASSSTSAASTSSPPGGILSSAPAPSSTQSGSSSLTTPSSTNAAIGGSLAPAHAASLWAILAYVVGREVM
ncbi:hypothetical protein PHLGIDRAFT_128214 [Phlebiopsis gigantea 11061_1 CR5-6]|uniref:Uncharacterized protein n=1 Tax=Phlebiopsis gigantea (strain 11061_1 CR5-6) TaxID=745531 RepID=A0A0C3RXH4_PHLG1|nr:hypothetical protein PHLGIDRAFT_128214 [Phlebiopsis gigantea 11061_1 CR5-6]